MGIAVVPENPTHKEVPCIPSPRCFLLSEIEKEEKEKLWYYSQLQGLSKRLDELPHVDTVSSRAHLRKVQGCSGGKGAGSERTSPQPLHPPSSFRCRWI